MHDHPGVPAQFEHNFFLSGAPLDVPPNRRASCEADQLDAVITHQQSRVFIREWEHVERAVRQPSLLDRLSQ